MGKSSYDNSAYHSRHYVVLPWLRNPTIQRWLAITIGQWTFSRRPLTAPERVHEDVHAAQWRRYPLTFPLRYLMASLEAWHDGDDWYRGNWFEIEAYAAEAQWTSSASA